jgi:hypothetical protein
MALAVSASADGQLLDAGTPMALFQTRLASGDRVIPGRPQYGLAPDGRFLMNVVVDEAPAPPITVVLNWTSELKK